MSTKKDSVVCIGHLRRHAANTDGKDPKYCWDQLAVFCVGGTRIVGLDASRRTHGEERHRRAAMLDPRRVRRSQQSPDMGQHGQL